MFHAKIQADGVVIIASTSEEDDWTIYPLPGPARSLTETDDGIVIEYTTTHPIDGMLPAGSVSPVLIKDLWTGGTKWWVHERRPGQFKTTDGCTFLVDGTSIALNGLIFTGYALEEGFLAILFAGMGTGNNVYLYDYDGTLKWQIEVASFAQFPKIPFSTMEKLLPNGNPFVSKGGTASEVDIRTGKIIREVPWK